jgi:hypothetical protein
MYRYTEPVIIAVLFPVAVLLLLFGIRALRLEKTSGLGLKLAIVLNTSLAIILGWVGYAKAENTQEFKTCYIMMMPEMPDGVVPAEFQKSDGWHDLEQAVVDLEYEITADEFDYDKYDEFSVRISTAQSELAYEGLLDRDELDVISAYCSERLAWYLHMVGGATCYKPMPTPTGREETLGNAVARAMELRDLYADYSFTSDAYDAALAALEDHLREYTGDEDVSTLRQLILDLADGVKYD